MAPPKKASALAGIFDDAPARASSEPKARRKSELTPERSKDSPPGKKAVLIHIPADMHRTLRQYLVQPRHTRFGR